jgi:hypothetical protein
MEKKRPEEIPLEDYNEIICMECDMTYLIIDDEFIDYENYICDECLRYEENI